MLCLWLHCVLPPLQASSVQMTPAEAAKARRTVPASVHGSPNYWRRYLHETLAAAAHFGMPHFFLTLTTNEWRWQELRWLAGRVSKATGFPEGDDFEALTYAPNEVNRLFQVRPAMQLLPCWTACVHQLLPHAGAAGLVYHRHARVQHRLQQPHLWQGLPSATAAVQCCQSRCLQPLCCCRAVAFAFKHPCAAHRSCRCATGLGALNSR